MTPLWELVAGWYAVVWEAGLTSGTLRGVRIVEAKDPDTAARLVTAVYRKAHLPGFRVVAVNEVAQGIIPGLE